MSGPQFRQQGVPNSPLCAPGRDVAYAFPAYLQSAAGVLEKVIASPDFAEHLAALDITQEDVAKTAKVLSDAYARVVEKPPHAVDPSTVLQEVGFWKCPFGARLLVLATIGQFLFGAAYTGVREASTQDRPMVGVERIYEACVAGRMMCEANLGVEVDETADVCTKDTPREAALRMAFEHAKEIAADTATYARAERHQALQLAQDMAVAKSKLADLAAQLAAADAKHRDLASDNNKLYGKLERLTDHIEYLKSTWLFRLFKWWIYKGPSIEG